MDMNSKGEDINRIYPSVIVKTDSYGIEIESYLRKNFEGKWYLILFHYEYRFSDRRPDFNEIKLQAFSRLQSDVYNGMILMRLSTNLITTNNKPVFNLDENQESEEERLQNLLFQ